MAVSPTLIDEIAVVAKRASTQSLDLSFNELLDMHKNGELDIAPDYQRLFRWSEGQRSRFVESLLLEMPVPPIFVIESEGGKYLLIDGLQRISSYLHLRGSLNAPHLDPPVVPGAFLELSDCDIVKSLNGQTFDSLPGALQVRLKRAFIRVEVVRLGADPRFKYHMFKRLNTGGDLLSPQQLRNCTIRMLSVEFPDFINTMSANADFVECLKGLTQEKRLSAIDQELVLRFFALKNFRPVFKHDVSDFLTEYMEAVADPAVGEPFDYAVEKLIFEKTFGLLKAALGDKAFAFANRTRTELSAGFSTYHYESIVIGLQTVLDRIDPQNPAHVTLLSESLTRTKLDPAFITLASGGGKNSPGKLTERIQFVEERLRSAFA